MPSANKVDVVARVLAVLAIVVSLASLGWQVYTWRRSTGRIKVRLDKVTEDFSGGYGIPEDVAEVTARNVGSGQAFIEAIAFVVTSSVPLVWRKHETSPPISDSLAAGEARTWRFRLSHQGEKAEPVTLSLRAVVEMGDGRKRWSQVSRQAFVVYGRGSEAGK